MNNNKRFIWSKGFIFFIIFLPAVFFMGFVVMFLWNQILPNAVHANPITYWQGLGLLILSKILFGSFHRRHWGADRRMHGMGNKFANMTPEEKEQFKSEWREKCDRWTGKSEMPASSGE